MLWKLGGVLHYRLKDLIVMQFIHALTQLRMRGLIERLIARHGVQRPAQRP